MSRSVYPTDADVQALCEGLNIIFPTEFGLVGFAASAIDEWERRTGYQPFLGSSALVTKVYDPPGANRRLTSGFSLLGGGRVLDLGCAMYAITSVTIGVGVDAPGTVLTQGSEFWMEPLNAPSMNNPWERVRFRAPVFGMESSVQISGNVGFGSVIPEDSWQAILRLGGALLLETLVEGLRAGSVIWQEDKVREELSPVLVGQVGQSFRSFAETVLLRYIRVGQGC